MRATEFLTEANLAPAEIRKHGGKYIKTLVRKIQDGDPIDIVPAKQDEFGTSVLLKKDNVKLINNAWFGSDEIPDTSDMNLTPNNDVIPASPDVSKLELETTDGRIVTLGMLQKTADYKGGRTFNVGDIGEGMLGAAVTARVISRETEITEQDVLNVIKQLGEGELVGKNNLRGAMSGESSNDKVHFNLVLNQANFNALTGSAKSPKEIHPEILGALRSSVIFANTNSGVIAAVDKIVSDKNTNHVTINSDGVSDQRGTKADLFLDVDGTTINLLSLKAGDVKQFGQRSGYSFEQLDSFFNETFGVNLPNSLEDDFESDDPHKSFEAIHKAYNILGSQLQSELAGDDVTSEVNFIERLYRGIKHHAVGEHDETSLVVLKTTPNAAGFTQLRFGQELRDAMDNIDLRVEYNASGTGTAIVKVFGVPKDGTSDAAVLIQVRSNLKSEGKGYVRNIVEMGPLLKIIAQIEKNIAK